MHALRHCACMARCQTYPPLLRCQLYHAAWQRHDSVRTWYVLACLQVALAKKPAEDADMAVSAAAQPPAQAKEAAALPKKVIVGRVVHEEDSSGNAAPSDDHYKSPAATADVLIPMNLAKVLCLWCLMICCVPLCMHQR